MILELYDFCTVKQKTGYDINEMEMEICLLMILPWLILNDNYGIKACQVEQQLLSQFYSLEMLTTGRARLIRTRLIRSST